MLAGCSSTVSNALEEVERTSVAVDATTPVVVPGVVPVSPTASSNARIATSQPGAMAAQRHMGGAGRFHLDTAALDTDRNGVLTQAEVAGNVSLSTHFAAIDVNTDGRLANDELRTWIGAGGLARHARPLGDALSGVGMDTGARFGTLDTDGDGVLTSNEAGVHAGLRTRFRTLDRNGDGRLSSTEFGAWSGTR